MEEIEFSANEGEVVSVPVGSSDVNFEEELSELEPLDEVGFGEFAEGDAQCRCGHGRGDCVGA